MNNKDYINQLHQTNHPLLIEMEEYAKVNKVPIMERDGIELLKQVIKIHQPTNILEIGTAIGYSAIQMAQAYDRVRIETLEIDENRVQEATNYIFNAELQDRIQVLHEDASVWLKNSTRHEFYDLIFIDAAKGQYKFYVEQAMKVLKPGGVIVIDNVLFKGFVADPSEASSRMSNIAKKIDHFNQWLMKDNRLETTYIDAGDGVAIAIKR